jgi:hypothetical protein
MEIHRISTSLYHNDWGEVGGLDDWGQETIIDDEWKCSIDDRAELGARGLRGLQNQKRRIRTYIFQITFPNRILKPRKRPRSHIKNIGVRLAAQALEMVCRSVSRAPAAKRHFALLEAQWA